MRNEHKIETWRIKNNCWVDPSVNHLSGTGGKMRGNKSVVYKRQFTNGKMRKSLL